MTSEEIIKELPYQSPFLFVDEIQEVHDSGIVGNYTLKEEEFFYKGHFKNKAITPGVILTEIMAQIGLVSYGIYLMKSSDQDKNLNSFSIGMTQSCVDFYKPVYPGEQVKVVANQEFFRFQKLKCKVELYRGETELVARGTISGMIAKYE